MGRGRLSGWAARAEGSADRKKFIAAIFFSPGTCGGEFSFFIFAMTSVDKTVATLSTVHGFVSDDTQCEAFRESLRALSMVRDVAFTIHEVSMKATASGAPGAY